MTNIGNPNSRDEEHPMPPSTFNDSSRRPTMKIENMSNPYENPENSVKIAKVEQAAPTTRGKRIATERSASPISKRSKPELKEAEKKKETEEEKETAEESASESESEYSSLGSDLDDDDDEEPETENMILCQYTKVHRVKNRWKCQLKDGLIRVRGTDRLFKECQGEFEF